MEIPTKSDRELLHAIGAQRDAAAFEQIVNRYLNLVYGAASRQVNSAQVDDVTQAVFLLLWQRAARLGDQSVLAGWLVNATRFVAMQVSRGEARRKRRERVAYEQQSKSTGDTVKQIDELTPLLDKALHKLGDNERSAVVLRYLQGKSLAEIAQITGVSEAAAAKRVSRGVFRLRHYFHAHGLEISIAAIGPALVEQAQRIISPAGLAQQTISNAVATHPAVGATLAKRAATSMAFQKAKSIAGMAMAATVLVALVCAALWMFADGSKFVTNAPSESTLNERRISLTPQPIDARPPIKVGLIVSTTTALAQSPMDRPWGYDVQTRIARDLRASDIELHAIVETGTSTAPGMNAQMQLYFYNLPPIDCADSAALKSLDVIVVNENWIVTDDLLKAVDQAVYGGVGMLNDNGIGSMGRSATGDDPITEHLAGMTNANFATNEAAVTCRVLAAHPILGNLTANDTVMLRPMGVYGTLPADATPLIQISDDNLFRATNNPAAIFYPVYLSHYGQGKIIGCQFARNHAATSQQLSARSQFSIRCIRWLAGRPIAIGGNVIAP